MRRPLPAVFCLLLFSAFLVSCAPAAPAAQVELVKVYSTPAAQPWLSDLFACADQYSLALEVSAESPAITLRLGEPELSVSPMYQIGEEEILIVAHRESPVQNLTLSQAQELFAQGAPAVQVWGYASDADLQIVFDQLVMKGRPVTSSAKMAANSQQMSDLLNAEKSAVGILPKHWVAGNAREVFSAGSVPVLAVTDDGAGGAVQSMIACLQSN